MQMGMVSLKLAHYRNQLLYFFVPEAMVLLTIHCDKEHSFGEPCSLRCNGDSKSACFTCCRLCASSPSTEECRQRFLALHVALSREFVLPQISVGEVS